MAKLPPLLLRICRDFLFRTRILLPLSAAVSAVLGAYYAFIALGNPSLHWQLAIVAWYAILFSGKLFVLSRLSGRGDVPSTQLVTAAVLLLLAFSSQTIMQLLYWGNARLTLPDSSLFFNGFLFVTTASSFVGSKHFSPVTPSRTAFRCRKYLSRAESLFALILLFVKLSEYFGWLEDGDLRLAQYLGGVVVALYLLLLCLQLLLAVRRQMKGADGDPALLRTLYPTR